MNTSRPDHPSRSASTTSSIPSSAAPYGVYDIADNKGWVSVGIDHAAFAVNAIRSWWIGIGRQRYPNAQSLTITADVGGSNGSRVRLWKVELQKLADETGLSIVVLHLPPGTSKWNKIEHRLFSFISKNWRGRPLTDYRTIVELIGATTSNNGLTVRCQLDENHYPAGIKVADAEMDGLNIRPQDPLSTTVFAFVELKTAAIGMLAGCDMINRRC